ncbi:hypothetical protein SASPL_136989 [Salvia splendens]|uniref:F-box associated beta-propeller type 1 domain-containing protein n=2 Tax=Salvia splendens TaxID=180675 RepID=A0A8X8WU30_SALSN|nr:hypothetical protein SASPL_136989 [Salvia splendens]
MNCEFTVPIAICNPFLGELKLLPPSNSSCDLVWQRNVAIGFDEDYKVVQLLSCDQHDYLHAQIYSKSTDSWRDLGDVCIDDVKFYAVYPIKSACKNGYFVHWLGDANEVGGDGVSKILSFDMKNEVFRAITLPEDYAHIYYDGDTRPLCHIFAEDEHSFRIFDFSIYGSDNLVRIYDSRCEGSELSWNHVMNVHVPLSISEIEVPLCRTSCVFFVDRSDESVCVYDYRARKFISRYSLPDFKPFYYGVVCLDRIIEYKGSLVSLEN